VTDRSGETRRGGGTRRDARRTPAWAGEDGLQRMGAEREVVFEIVDVRTSPGWPFRRGAGRENLVGMR